MMYYIEDLVLVEGKIHNLFTLYTLLMREHLKEVYVVDGRLVA